MGTTSNRIPDVCRSFLGGAVRNHLPLAVTCLLRNSPTLTLVEPEGLRRCGRIEEKRHFRRSCCFLAVRVATCLISIGGRAHSTSVSPKSELGFVQLQSQAAATFASFRSESATDSTCLSELHQHVTSDVLQPCFTASALTFACWAGQPSGP